MALYSKYIVTVKGFILRKSCIMNTFSVLTTAMQSTRYLGLGYY